MKTLFLDFDGVLYDTLKEAYVLCRQVVNGIDIFTPIEKETYNKFFRYKFLVYNSWQYLYLMKTINESEKSSDKEFIDRFNYYLTHRNITEEENFDREYLKKRIWLTKMCPDYVDSLEKKFPFFDMINKLDKNEYEILIVSRKNSFAIKRKGIDFKIVGKEELENVTHKSEFIEKYIRENNINKAYFIDDNSNNFTTCKHIKNLTCLLAGWGNIGIDETGLTQDEIYNIILQ